MRKLTAEQKFLQDSYRHRRWLRDLRRKEKWDNSLGRAMRGRALGEGRISVPNKLDFGRDSYEDTTRFFYDLKSVFLRRRSVGRRATLLAGMPSLSHISVAAALVFTSEVDRVRRLRLERTTVFDKDRKSREREVEIELQEMIGVSGVADWNQHVSAILFSVGFFRVLGCESELPKRVASVAELSYGFAKLASGIGFSGRTVGALLRDDWSDESFWREKKNEVGDLNVLYKAILEAAYNAGQHAYPEKLRVLNRGEGAEDEGEWENVAWKFEPCWKRWWGANVVDRETGWATIVVYDQGVGIPATLERKYEPKEIRSVVKSISEFFVNVVSSETEDSSDGEYIAAAFEIGRTSRDNGEGRGQGLSDITASTELGEEAVVCVRSRNGEALYRNEESIETTRHSRHVGGTLIEWRIPSFATLARLASEEISDDTSLDEEEGKAR